MSLSKGEILEIDGKNGERILTIVKMVGSDTNNGRESDIHLWDIKVSKVEGRITKSTQNAYRIRSMSNFKRLNPRKVTIDPLGRIRRAGD